MTITIAAPLVCLCGLLLYIFGDKIGPKAVEIGRIMFWVALLVVLASMGGRHGATLW